MSSDQSRLGVKKQRSAVEEEGDQVIPLPPGPPLHITSQAPKSER